MGTLLVRLRGPMQSWGVWGREDNRTTESVPTKSGVLGLIANVMGRDRTDDIADLAALRFGVRVLSPKHVVVCDFQTVGARTYLPTLSGNTLNKNGIVRKKFIVEDGDFLVGLEGDALTLESIAQRLRRPIRVPFLGRKAYSPTLPLFDSISDESLENALVQWRPANDCAKRGYDTQADIEMFLDMPYDPLTATIPDQPVNYASREYLPRSIARKVVKPMGTSV